jgi:hypothetical protein
MQVDSGNNYNTLGRMGPIYPRPEYRPKGPPKENTEETKGGAQDKVKLTGGQGDKAKAKAQKERGVQAQPVVAEGRLNLQSAKVLTQITAEAITQLPPDGRNQGPHSVKGTGLLSPRYV